MNAPWSCLLPAQQGSGSAFLHITCTPESTARVGSTSNSTLPVSGTKAGDRLVITLLHASDGRGCAELRVFATRAPIQVGSMTPTGMEPAMYCQLLDDVLRWPTEGASNEVQMQAPPPPPRATSARVELRLVSHTKNVSLLLSALDLYAVEPAAAPVAAVLGAFSGALRQLNTLSTRGAVWQEEQQRLRRQLEVVAAGQLAERDEGLLTGVQRIVNAKKDKIRELTVALHAQAQTRAQAAGQQGARAPPPAEPPHADSGSDTATTHESEEDEDAQQQPRTAPPQPTLGASYRAVPGDEETLQDTYMQPHDTLDEMAGPADTQNGKDGKEATRKRKRSGKGEEDWLQDLYAIQ